MRTSIPSTRCMAIIAIAMAMVSASCSPRKAMQRRCGKADRHIARAVVLCPDVLMRDSATVQLPATATTRAISWSDSVDTPGLLAACDSLRQALEALRNTAPPPQESGRPAHLRPAVQQAVQAVQRTACRWEAFTDTVNGVVISVYPGTDGTPLLMVEQLARTVKAPCPPAVQRPPCPGVLEQLMATLGGLGWGLLLWAAVATACLYLFARYVKPHLRS